MSIKSKSSSAQWRNCRFTAALLAGAALIAMAQPAVALDVTLSLGAGLAPDYEGSEDYEAVPAWLLIVNDLYDPHTNVVVRGPQLRSNLVPHPQFRAGISGLYVPERSDVDNNQVDNLRDTDAGLMLGGGIGWDFFPQREISLVTAVDLVADVTGNNGYLVTPYVAYGNALPGTPLSVGAELFTNWASDDYMEEQFGISANDAARSGLNQFNADEGFKDVGLRGNVTYRFTERWSSTFAAQYKLMVGDAADSPVVDDAGSEHQFVAGVTVNFHF
jgi:MipA family protein